MLVARVLMAEPELLLFDEPCAGLDLGGREAMVAVLGELRASTATDRPLVMVTHHLEEIPLGITHALLLREGSVVAAGPIGETLTSAAVSETFGLSRGGRGPTGADGPPGSGTSLTGFDTIRVGCRLARWPSPRRRAASLLHGKFHPCSTRR